MNEWVKRSIEIANAPGYLDKLYEVYPVIQESEREISEDIKSKLKEIYNAGDDRKLVRELLKLPKFPINDPYVAFLRKREVFINYNPKTVQRISKRIRLIGYNKMIEAIEEPKIASKQIGILFRRWLTNLGYPFLSVDDFRTYDKIAFLRGSDAQLKDFANTMLSCDLDKGPDLIAKVGIRYVIGEAKFLTDYGGAQNANFEDALRLLKSKKGNAIRIAVLDGVVWIKNRTKMHRTVCQLEEVALTALLLENFLESLRAE